jgi:putative endonuclease
LAKAGGANVRELRLASQPRIQRRSRETARHDPENEDGLEPMKYVYLLQSIAFPDQTYVGLTDDLRARFSAHNEGRSLHTDKFKPWRLVTYVAFSDDQKAVEFERYLKSASGRAFAKKRLR